MNVIVQPAARADVLNQYRWYMEQNVPDVADRFLAAFNASVKSIITISNAGSPRHFLNPYLEGMRVWPIKGFKELRIYYLLHAKNLIIARVLHDKRDVGSILAEQDTDEED